MPRPPLPLGSHGKISSWPEGKGYVARTKFRDYDGVVRSVKRYGKSKAAAERALKVALTERRVPVAAAEVTPYSTFAAAAELWFEEVERLVDDGQRSPSTLDKYRYTYDTYVQPALGALRVREVTTPVVDRALLAFKTRSVASARIARAVIAGVMRLAARHGAVTVNPVREVGQIESAPNAPAPVVDGG